MINKEKVTIGFDPEFILKDVISGRHISGLNFEFGSKGMGREICPNCTVENDMVTIETVLPPVNLIGGVGEMWDTYSTVKQLIEAELPENIKLDCCSEAEFSEEDLQDERAMVGGCSTDFNAWNDGLPNDKPDFITNWRCSGK